MSWLSQAFASSDPYTDVPVNAAIIRRVEERGPAPAVGGEDDGEPQAAPAVVPATVEQQRATSAAAVQYGGAKPYNGNSVVNTNVLYLVGLGLAAAWFYLRQRDV